MAGGCDLCTGTASLKGSGELQAFDGLVRGSDASQHRLLSLRVLLVPGLVLVLLFLSTERPPAKVRVSRADPSADFHGVSEGECRWAAPSSSVTF